MNISKPLLAALIAGFVAVGCTPPEVQEDEEPVEEPTAQDDEADEPAIEEEDEQEVAEQEEEEEEVDPEDGVVGMVAVAEMISGEEETIGEVTFTQTQQGVLVEGRIQHDELGPTDHGFHVHEFGECDAPDFESAGGHFNPTDHPHGGPHDDPEQRHAGDFGNLQFDPNGIADFEFVDDVITVGSGTNDIVGQALIVHYEEDDLETQPTGDAGPRAGCGTIEVETDPRDDQ